MSIYGERIGRLDERVDELSTRMGRVEDKLDQLLSLKNKGAGAFWLVGLIISSGVLTAVIEVIRWLFRH